MSKSESKSSEERLLVYVVAGKDAALVSFECERLVDSLLPKEQRLTALLSSNAAEVSIAQVFDELRTLPFLAEKRVVVLKEADKFVSENRQFLENYFDGPSPTGVLILGVNSWPAQTKLAKKLPEIGRLISIEQPKSWQLPQRIIEYAQQAHDKKLDRESAELLVELTGESLSSLYCEIDKLALFVHPNKAITHSDIEALIGHNRLYNAFAVIDNITAGQPGQAVMRLRKMFAEDKSAEYTVVGAFAYHFRRMFKASVLLSKGINYNDIAKQLGIWGNKEGFFAQVRRMSTDRIGAILQRLADMDFMIKTGQTKAPIAAEQLVLELAGKTS